MVVGFVSLVLRVGVVVLAPCLSVTVVVAYLVVAPCLFLAYGARSARGSPSVAAWVVSDGGGLGGVSRPVVLCGVRFAFLFPFPFVSRGLRWLVYYVP